MDFKLQRENSCSGGELLWTVSGYLGQCMTNSTAGGSFLLWTVFLAVFGYLGRTWNYGFMGFIQG